MQSYSSILALFIVIIGCAGCFQSSQPEPSQADADSGSLAVLATTPTESPSEPLPESPANQEAALPTATLGVPTVLPTVAPTILPTIPSPPEPTSLPTTPAANEQDNQPAAESATSNGAATTFLAEGEASRISDNFQGDLMANGQPYDKDALLAAHKELPFGTIVRVTNLNTGLSVDVTITDRIPSSTEQVIDVSRAASVQLGMPDMGTAAVRLENLQ